MSVKLFLLNEFVMSSLFLYPTVLQDDDAVGIFYGLEPVGNGNDGASFNQRVDGFLYFHFIFGVK